MMSQQEETPHQIISNVLHANTENIPENDYMRAQNALMRLNNN